MATSGDVPQWLFQLLPYNFHLPRNFLQGGIFAPEKRHQPVTDEIGSTGSNKSDYGAAQEDRCGIRLERVPVEVCETDLSARLTAQEPSKVVAGHQNRYHCQWCVEPGTGNTGHFVETEEECQGNGHGRVHAKEGGKTDKNPHRKTGGNMAGMGVEGEYFFKLLLDFIGVYHSGPGRRPLYDFAVCFVNLLDFTITLFSAIKRLE